jgi:hypothetical protein
MNLLRLEFVEQASSHLRWRRRQAKRRLVEILPKAANRLAPTHKFTYRDLGRHGRLGNQLFQIAGTIGLSHAHGTEPVFPQSWKYRSLFSLPEASYGGALTIARSEDGWKRAPASTEEFMQRYLQDISLWDGVHDRIRAWLQPSALAIARLLTAWEHVLAMKNTTALHVRRGDYLERNVLVPPGYYDEALATIWKQHGAGPILVFSDDLDWCRSNLDVDNAIYVDGNPDWLDLALMSRCAHHICANSTFSWWGAFLSRDPSPIVPWFPGVHPDFSLLNPGSWRLFEVSPDRGLPSERPARKPT